MGKIEMEVLVNRQREFFLTGETLDYKFRKRQLSKMKNMLEKYEEDLYHALKNDLNKSEYEAFTTELGFLHTEINFALKHLKDWMQPKKVETPVTHKGSKSFIRKEPYGVTLIIAPWNYPLHLAIAPAIGAIAAGNTVVLKPSEFTQSTSAILADMIRNTFDESYFTVVEGAKDISQQLLE